MRLGQLARGFAVVAFGTWAGLVMNACSSASGVCVVGGVSHQVGASFPSSDGCNTCSCGANGTVACTTRACIDAGAAGQGGGDAALDSTADAPPAETPDGGPDGAADGAVDTAADGPASDGPSSDVPAADVPAADAADAAACTLATTYMFWNDGGLVAYSDESTLTPARTHTVERTAYFNGSDGKRSCARELPCASATAVSVAAVQAAIAQPDVQAALAKAPGMLYGSDPRPVDGTVWVFKRGDGRSFMVGGGPSVPAGLAALEALLRKLQSETLATPPCAALAP